MCFSDGLVCLDKVFEDLHHGLLLDVAQAAVIKQGLQSLSSACWLLKLQQQLILVCGREVYLHTRAGLQHVMAILVCVAKTCLYLDKTLILIAISIDQRLRNKIMLYCNQYRPLVAQHICSDGGLHCLSVLLGYYRR